MMRRSLALCLLLGIALTVAQCAPSLLSMPTSTPGLGLHLLADLSGDLSHKRPGWETYQPLSFGAALDQHDLLRAAPDARGLIVCADLSLAQVPPGYHGGLPCPRAKPVLEREESLVVGPRREEPMAASIPYIFSPRHTFIQMPHPLLRWHPSTGGSITYTVRVWGGNLDWRTETIATALTYPNSAPPLAPETLYYLAVVDAEGRSSEEEQTTLDMSFCLLPMEEVEAVRALVAQAQTLGLAGRATQLLEAEICAAHRLRADAIVMLEELAAEEDAPAVHRRLGDLYLEVGLYAEAQEAYQRALDGYRALGDRAGEAATQVRLGLAVRLLGGAAAAREHLMTARALYEQIGDQDGVEQVQRLLTE